MDMVKSAIEIQEVDRAVLTDRERADVRSINSSHLYYDLIQLYLSGENILDEAKAEHLLVDCLISFLRNWSLVTSEPFAHITSRPRPSNGMSI